WLTAGCKAHGYALSFKDIANAAKCRWGSKVVDAILMISNTINNSERIKSAVHAAQVTAYSSIRAIAVNAPTRFACQLFIARDIHASKAALKATVLSEDWADVSSSSIHGNRLRDAILGNGEYSSFWQRLDRYLELMQPFSDAIHQLEADRPMLSQVHDVHLKLHEHTAAFEKKYPECKGVVALYNDRYKSTIYDAATLAAFCIDP
ncbi:hypothetical protein Agub_g4173, partial [Astrephomene gubernaculifera]